MIHSPQARLEVWLDAIINDPQAHDGRAAGIIEHIQTHAGAHLQAYVDEGKDMRMWAAGMLNLMRIFEGVVLQGRPIKAEEMLSRLESAGRKRPWATPFPL